jgi:hypothetical protein
MRCDISTSSPRIASASASAASTPRTAAAATRSAAQARFTAVGRVAFNAAMISVSAAGPWSRRPSHTAKPAVTPMSPAPRMCMSRRAVAQSCHVRRVSMTRRCGRWRWSMTFTTSPSRQMDWRACPSTFTPMVSVPSCLNRRARRAQRIRRAFGTPRSASSACSCSHSKARHPVALGPAAQGVGRVVVHERFPRPDPTAACGPTPARCCPGAAWC